MHHLILDKLGNDGTGTVITQTAGMYVGRVEIVAQCVHRQQRSISGFITEVVFELTSCQFRTTLRFGSDKLSLFAIENVMTHERESNAAEVGTAPEAGDDHIRIFAGHLHLFFSLKTDDSLMKGDMTQNRTQCIFTVRCRGSQFDSL